jgi:hypothetical protein
MQKITCKFILMTCDSDTTIPFGCLDDNDFSNLINNVYLIRWYSVNCIQEKHYKLTLIPLGINLHSIALNQHKGWKWTNEQLSPLETEKVMISIKNTSKPFYERNPTCYSNFHFELRSSFNNPRREAIFSIPDNLIFYEPNRINLKQTWLNQSEYAFVVSPHGNGYDTHRTWEALILGCIVIVKRSPLDILYKDLPVLIVNEWTDITKELLDNTIQQFKNITFNYEKITTDYWKTLIKSGKELC